MCVWEFGNVCMGICMYVCLGIWECVYGNMGMWYVWEFGNVLWEYGNVVCKGIWECIMGIWECVYGNLGIWECMYGNRECGMYGNMGMWGLQYPYFCNSRTCFFSLYHFLLLLDNLLRPALWPYQYWRHRKYQKPRGRDVCLLYWDKNFYFCYNNRFNHCYFLSSFQMQG